MSTDADIVYHERRMKVERIPDREEMIRMAVETRKQVTNAVVTREEMERYPAAVRKLKIPTRWGDSEAYLACREQELKEVTPLVINFHGGGFIRERTENDELFCRKLAHSLRWKTLDVDYRLAPEHPFPIGLYECHDVVCWAMDHPEELGIDPERIFLMGHSAGGNFVAGVCMLLKEEGRPLPLALVLDYPPMDLATDPEHKEIKGKGIPAQRARLYNLYYCEKKDQTNSLASPLLAQEESLRGFPKTLVITAGEDSLCTEAEAFALKLARAGNEVTLKRFLGAKHGFTIYRTAGHEEAFRMILGYCSQRILD